MRRTTLAAISLGAALVLGVALLYLARSHGPAKVLAIDAQRMADEQVSQTEHDAAEHDDEAHDAALQTCQAAQDAALEGARYDVDLVSCLRSLDPPGAPAVTNRDGPSSGH